MRLHDDIIIYLCQDSTELLYRIGCYHRTTRVNTILLESELPIRHYTSRDGSYLFLEISHYDDDPDKLSLDSTDIYYIHRDTLLYLRRGEIAPVNQFTERLPGHRYWPTYHEGHFLIQTNREGATHYRIMRTEVGSTQIANWKHLIPHDDTKFVETIIELCQYLLIAFTDSDGNKHLGVIPYDMEHDLYNVEAYHDIGESLDLIDISYVDDGRYDTKRILYKTLNSIFEYDIER